VSPRGGGTSSASARNSTNASLARPFDRRRMDLHLQRLAQPAATSLRGAPGIALIASVQLGGARLGSGLAMRAVSKASRQRRDDFFHRSVPTERRSSSGLSPLAASSARPGFAGHRSWWAS